MNVNQQRVLSIIGRPKWARHLLLHERRDRVINTKGAYYYLDPRTGKARILSGLCPRLQKTFWSHTSYYAIMKQTRKEAKASGVVKRKKKKNKKKLSMGPYGGLIKGSRVHSEMNDFVLLDAEAFKKLHRGPLHPCTLMLLKAIVDKLKLHPFLPEYDVACETARLGTSIDLICVDADGHIVLLEFKTGYAESWLTCDGYMERSLQLMPCSPQNQASTQLMAGAMLLHRRYDVPLEEMLLYVLRCDEDVVEIVPVPMPFVRRLGDKIYQDLLDVEQEGA